MKAGGDVREATRQQKLFIDEYLKLRKSNATQAAINAGYSKKTAQPQSSQLLINPYVLKYLHEREKAITQELQEEFVFDAIEARKVMSDILNNPDARDIDKINIAKDFLDRAGFKPLEKVEHSGEIDISNKAREIEERLFGKDG